ncbi:MAG: VWA domain-containing protein [Candidatus Polarisedimenticolia bacterium]|nr:VWA domain-containing protein [bacterium]
MITKLTAVRWIKLVGLGMVAAVGPGPCIAQEDPLPIGLTENVRIDLVQFNVLATDKRGNPVFDLKPEDLRLFDGGTEQRVSFVEPYAAPLPVQVSAKQTPTASRQTVEDTAAKPGRYLTLFFDTAGTSLRTRNMAIPAARDFVERELRPRDRVAVVNFTGKLKMVQTFTSDRALILAAVDMVAGDMKNTVEDRVGAIDQLIEDFRHCSSLADSWGCASKHASEREFANWHEQSAFLTALTSFARAIAPIPAAKTVILFTDGVPARWGAEIYAAAEATLGDSVASALANRAPLASENRLWDRFAEAAASARVSVFAICPNGGFGRFASVSARNEKPSSEIENRSQIDPYRESESNFAQGAAILAERTGGRLLRSNDLDVSLKEASRVSSGLYTVGFQPRGVEVGTLKHNIKVKSNRKGVTIEYARDVPRRVIRQILKGEVTTEKSACEGDRRQLLVRLRLDRASLAFEETKKILSANFAVYTELLVDGIDDPAFVDYRFFNASRDAKVASVDAGADPTVEQRLIVPCSGLRLALTATDAATGARAVFTARIEK